MAKKGRCVKWLRQLHFRIFAHRSGRDERRFRGNAVLLNDPMEQSFEPIQVGAEIILPGDDLQPAFPQSPRIFLITQQAIERTGKGGALGYYDPATRRFAGTHEQLDTTTPRGLRSGA